MKAPGRRFAQGRHYTQRSAPREKDVPRRGVRLWERTVFMGRVAPRKVTVPREGMYPRTVLDPG